MTKAMEGVTLTEEDVAKIEAMASEYEIIKYRDGLEGNVALTQREIAQMVDISRSYISRIEKKALEKIKVHVSKEDLNC